MSSDEHPPTASPLSPSHPHVTASDHTSLLIVVGWFSVVIIVIILLTRLGTRHAKSRTVGFDDAAIILSTVRSGGVTSKTGKVITTRNTGTCYMPNDVCLDRRKKWPRTFDWQGNGMAADCPAKGTLERAGASWASLTQWPDSICIHDSLHFRPVLC
jgi:hypothetical protein